MWNRSRQGIQLTKQRLRDKLLAGPTSRSYFTRPLLSIGNQGGEKKREREREGCREKEQRKNVSAKQHEFMDEQFYLLLALVPSRVLAGLTSASAPNQGRAKVARDSRHELSPHPKYRATTPFFHPISSSNDPQRGEISVDFPIFDDFTCPSFSEFLFYIYIAGSNVNMLRFLFLFSFSLFSHMTRRKIFEGRKHRLVSFEWGNYGNYFRIFFLAATRRGFQTAISRVKRRYKWLRCTNTGRFWRFHYSIYNPFWKFSGTVT